MSAEGERWIDMRRLTVAGRHEVLMFTPGETDARGTDIYREAALVLLRMQAHQTFERTDASARKVEEALAALVEDQQVTTWNQFERGELPL